MSEPLDPTLSSDIDWVRVMIGDSDINTRQLEDDTIAALLAEAVTRGARTGGAKYCAAAQAGELLAARWQAKDKGAVSKQVSKLRIRFADGQALKAYREYLNTLKCRCTELSISGPSMIKSW